MALNMVPHIYSSKNSETCNRYSFETVVSQRQRVCWECRMLAVWPDRSVLNALEHLLIEIHVQSDTRS
jgi:hypothetical protein